MKAVLCALTFLAIIGIVIASVCLGKTLNELFPLTTESEK